MRISVAICTWNRAELLRKTLARMRELRIPDGVDWELLVVNNNCTDDTDAVIGEFEGALPVRRIFEPEPGLSHARNAAIAGAAGEYVVWTDDDVLVSPDWLAEYAAAFDRWPDAAVFGGPIEPWFDHVPPAWMERGWSVIQSAYAARELGDEVFPLVHQRLPYGANMAFRMVEQRRHPYDPELGYREHRKVSGEETAVITAILREGGTGWWIPGARVRHYIPPDRQTLAYIRRYYHGRGAIRAARLPPARRHLLGRPLWLLREVATGEVRYRLGRIFAPPEVWIRDLVISSRARGTLAAYRLGAARRVALDGPGRPAESDQAAEDRAGDPVTELT